MGQLDIFSYHDYRQYLKDSLSSAKNNEPKISLRTLAMKCGVSAAYLSTVIKGHKSLSEKVAKKITEVWGFGDEARSYFLLIRLIADTESPEERIQALNFLQKFYKYRQANPKESQTYKYLTKWYYVAIREMVALPGFKLDPKWIHKQLCFTVELRHIVSAINFLKKYNYIKVASDGSVSLSEKRIECMAGIYRVALSEYYKQIFDLSARAIDVIPREQRYLIGHMIPFSQSGFNEFKKLVDEFSKKVSQIAKPGEIIDSVYYIGMMGIPMAKLKSEKEPK